MEAKALTVRAEDPITEHYGSKNLPLDFRYDFHLKKKCFYIEVAIVGAAVTEQLQWNLIFTKIKYISLS